MNHMKARESREKFNRECYGGFSGVKYASSQRERRFPCAAGAIENIMR